MTIQHTTNFGIAYADSSTALTDLGTVTQQIANSLDAAMGRAGYTPPDSTSFAALSARVGALENPPTVALSLTGGILPVSGFVAPAYWQQGKETHLESVMQAPAAGIAANTVLFTLPVGARPAVKMALPTPVLGSSGYVLQGFDLLETGAFRTAAALAANAYVYLDRLTFLAA